MNVLKAYLIVAASLLMAVGVASAKELSAECVTPETVKSFNECPGGKPKEASNLTQGVTFTSALPTAGKPTKPKAEDPNRNKELDPSNYRRKRIEARQEVLLRDEIRQVEELVNSTPPDAADRKKILRRLAEDWVELEAAYLAKKTAADIAIQDSRAKGKKNTVAAGQALAAEKGMKVARKNAIKGYAQIVKEFPKDKDSDEVLYYLAYEHEQNNDQKTAQKVYKKLMKEFPNSKYLPAAYLAFGELFFVQAQNDPKKWPLAAGFYQQVLKTQPPENKVYGYAWYKLAYVYWNQELYKDAIDAFKKVIDYGKQFPQMPDAKQITNAARKDFITVYAAAGLPLEAYKTFADISGDPPGSNTQTFSMMDQLGFAYFDSGHIAETIELYTDLKKRDPGEKQCHYQAQITHATQALKSADKVAIKRELEAQLETRNKYKAGGWSAKAKQECDNETAGILAETAISWHIEAVGAGNKKGDRGTGDAKTMEAAADLYDKIVKNFTAQDFEKFTFPRLAKSSWPTIFRIKYYRAEIYWKQDNWEKCGPAFDAVVAENPTGPDAPGAAYAAVLCYQKMYEKKFAGKEKETRGLGPGSEKDDKKKKSDPNKYKPLAFTEEQKGMVTAFNRYVCYITPKDNDEEAKDDYIRVKYARARTYYEAQHWEEAALGFRDIALNYAKHDSGVYAAMLYLESMNVLGFFYEPPRAKCYSDMADDVSKFIELYCSKDRREKNQQQCEALDAVQFDIIRLAAQKTVERGDAEQKAGNVDKAIAEYRDGADKYKQLWEQYCKSAMDERKVPKRCEKADEIVYNMAQAYQAGRLLGKAIGARSEFRSVAAFKKSPLRDKVTYELGGNFQAIANYDRAASFYETYAKESDYKAEKASDALSDAVVLRLGLGQDKAALADAETFASKFRTAQGQAARIAFAVAAYYGEKGEWGDVQKRLKDTIGLIDRSAPLEVKLQAHALLGRSLVAIKQRDLSKTEFRKVIAMWGNNPVKAIEAIEKGGGDLRAVGRAMEAVGEALFQAAEEERAKAVAASIPKYEGQGTTQAVGEHITKKIVPWVQKKQTLIKKAQDEYIKILKICVGTPFAKQLFGSDDLCGPPRWVIAAGGRVGQLFGDFVQDFRSAPIPDFMKNDYQLRGAYFQSLDEKSQPWKEQAKAAYQTCLGYSTRFQYFDGYSRGCEEWLSKEYKTEYTVIDEFRGNPDKVNTALQEQPVPLTIKGQPVVRASKEPPKPDAAKPEAAKPDAAKDAAKPESTKPDAKAAPAAKAK